MQLLPDDGRDGSSSAGGELNAGPNPGAVDQLFDYASFMWDAGGDMLGHFSPGGAQVDFYAAAGWIVRYELSSIFFFLPFCPSLQPHLI